MTNRPGASQSSTGHGAEQSKDAAFGSEWWEQHYQETGAGRGAPSPHLVAEVTGLPAGTALDAGCGTGADAMWLARQGWAVTAIDISATAVGQAQRFAAELAPEVAARIDWVVADLTALESPGQYDLVVSQYVHPDVPFTAFVARLADAVSPGGMLLIAGHDHADSHSAEHAPESASIGPEAVVSALHSDQWDVLVAETRMRQVRHGAAEASMQDVVVKAHRKATP